MHYELWTIPSGNMIDDFASEAEALALVRELLAGSSLDAAESLLLTVVGDDGSGSTVATGATLAERALQVPSQADARPRIPPMPINGETV